MRKVPIGPKTIVHAASVSNGRSRQPPSFLLLPFFPLLPLPLLLPFRRRVFGVSSPLLSPASSSDRSINSLSICALITTVSQP